MAPAKNLFHKERKNDYFICITRPIVILAIWAVCSYNGFVKLKNTIEEAYSTMDVYLKKRFDLIPNLVNTVKAMPA